MLYKMRDMIQFDPENELTDKELDKIAEQDFDAFLNYLDQKSEYLKKFTKPLSSYHTKRFASMAAATSGRELSKEDYDNANKLGRKNEEAAIDKITKKEKKQQEIEMLKNNGVKNVKTDRTQWFD